jgi:hypothetical protein
MSRKIRTAEELEKMSPAEVDAEFRAGIIWEVKDAPPEIVARTRERILNRIDRTESLDQP